MENKIQFHAVDIMKFICALLVITIHTAPFIEVAPTVNFYLVQVIARIAVPFFFLVSGFLFFIKIDRDEGWKSEHNLNSLKRYLKRIGILYLCWSAIYLLFTLYQWFHDGFSWVMLLRYLRDFFLTGSCYHLWFLPSLMFGTIVVYFLYFKISYKHVGVICVSLYFVGMLMNVYGDILQGIPFISTLYKGYNTVFVTSRNGLFFAPVFILMGTYFANSESILNKRDALIGSLISFVLLCYEATMIKGYGYMHDLTSMYLFLLPLEFFMFSLIAQIDLKTKPIYAFLRKSSLLIYVSHIMFVFTLPILWKGLFHQAIGNLPLYVLTTICSLIFTVVCIYLSKTHFKWLKALY